MSLAFGSVMLFVFVGVSLNLLLPTVALIGCFFFEFLKEINVGHMTDWVKLEILACLCGANEPSGYIITKTHQLYVIDNEQMFSTEPSDPITCSNWFGHQTYDSAMEITLELCNQLSHIREKDIQEYSTLPEGYKVDEIWDIKQLIRKSVSYAKQFIERNA